MERESMLMYRSTREMLQDLKQEDEKKYLLGIEMYMDYAFDGTEPELSGKSLVTKLFWKASKPLIDANNKNYVNGCKGGAPTGNSNAKKTTQNNPKTTQKQPRVNLKTTQKQGNDNDNVNDNANDNVHVNANDNANDNVNVNVNKKENINTKEKVEGRNPYIDINTMSITDFDKYDEWNRQHGVEG